MFRSSVEKTGNYLSFLHKSYSKEYVITGVVFVADHVLPCSIQLNLLFGSFRIIKSNGLAGDVHTSPRRAEESFAFSMQRFTPSPVIPSHYTYSRVPSLCHCDL